MSRLSACLCRIPFRESRGLVLAWGVVCVVLAVGALRWPRPVKEEKAIARKQAEVAALKARGATVPTSAYPKVEHHVAVWLRRGWLINTALAGALLLASPWLGRSRVAGMRWVTVPRAGPMRGRDWGLLAGLMLAAAWQNHPRLFLSMWGDEEFNASRFIADEVSRDETGAIRVAPRPWTTTLWSFRKTTNHLGFSVLARLSHDAFFTRRSGPADPFFSEALIRLPVFLAGIVLIPALVWCGRVWGVSGWFAAVMGLLHPWFLRFGVDGRAYGLVLLAVPVMLALLGRGLQTGRWRWWLGLGFAEFFVFWCYFGSVYLLAALNAAALWLMHSGTRDREARSLLRSRWLVSGALAAMLVIGVMAPCWPQLFEFLEQKPISGVLDREWWRESFSELFFGMSWQPQTANPLEPAMMRLWGGPAVAWAAVAGAALLTGAGLVALGRDALRRALLVVVLLAPALMLAHMAHSGIRPYAWYLVPYLPGLLLVWAAAFPLGESGAGRWAPVLAVGALAAALGWTARGVHRHHPVESSRESVALYRTVTNPRHPDIEKEVISGGFVMYTEGYDPALRRFKNAEGLRALMDEADGTGRRLFVNVGHIEYARDFGFADVCALLDDPAQFEHVKTLPGLFFSTTREVYRWRGRAP